MDVDWNLELRNQVDRHWSAQLRPRLAGLTDDEALAQLDEAYTTWMRGVASLGNDGLARPCGPAEGPYADAPLATLVLHINRELLHHGAEIALLRDLYRARG